MKSRRWAFRAGAAVAALAGAVLINLGCGPRNTGGEKTASGPKEGDVAPGASAKEKKIEAARAKLSAADRALVEAQDYCPVMPKQKLGSMGVPHKMMIKGQPVFLCCESCKGTAEDEPDETLKAVAQLKAKSKKQ